MDLNRLKLTKTNYIRLNEIKMTKLTKTIKTTKADKIE